MIPDPDTLKRIRAQADVHVERSFDALCHLLPVRASALDDEIEAAIRRAYLAGADAGYAAAKAKERKP